MRILHILDGVLEPWMWTAFVYTPILSLVASVVFKSNARNRMYMALSDSMSDDERKALSRMMTVMELLVIVCIAAVVIAVYVQKNHLDVWGAIAPHTS